MFSTLAIQAVFSLSQVLSPSWSIFCALYFVVGMGAISNYVSAFVIGRLTSLTYLNRLFDMFSSSFVNTPLLFSHSSSHSITHLLA